VDINNAFTESHLREDIYIKPPPGVTINPGLALEVLRSLYRLKQATRDWNQRFISELLKLGFTQSQADPCLLIRPKKKITLLMYVDDILLVCKSLDHIQWFKDAFGMIFKIKDLGEVEKVLRVKVSRDRVSGTLRLDQTHYAREVLNRLSMDKDKEPLTKFLIDNNLLLNASNQDLRANKSEY
jgi:hypothetical protein